MLAARRLLTDTLAAIVGAEDDDSRWPWPEERLSYGNASIAEALVVAGDALPDVPALSRGLRLLEFLLRPDPARVVALLFLPGEELHGAHSRPRYEPGG